MNEEEIKEKLKPLHVKRVELFCKITPIRMEYNQVLAEIYELERQLPVDL